MPDTVPNFLSFAVLNGDNTPISNSTIFLGTGGTFAVEGTIDPGNSALTAVAEYTSMSGSVTGVRDTSVMAPGFRFNFSGVASGAILDVRVRAKYPPGPPNQKEASEQVTGLTTE